LISAALRLEEQRRRIEEDARIDKAITASNEFWEKHEFI